MKKKKFFKKSVIATLFFVSVLVSVYIYKPTSLSTSITATTSGGAIITIEEDTLDMLNPTLTITFPFSLYYLQFDVDSIDRFITSLSGNTHTLTGSTLQGTTGGCTTGTSGFTILCESTATQNGNFDTIVLVLDRNNLENGVNNFVLNEILQSSSDGQQFEESGNVLFNISYIAPTASQALEGSETPGIPITTATNLAAGETLTLNTSSSIPAHNNGPCEGTFINGDISHCVQVFDDSGTLLYIVNMVGSTVVFNFTAAANPGAVLFRSSASAIALAPGTYTFVTHVKKGNDNIPPENRDIIASSSSSLGITGVAPSNNPPVAPATSAELPVNEGETRNFTELTSDMATDADGDSITYTLMAAPSNGTISVLRGGSEVLLDTTANNTFTQAEVAAGAVTYTHNNSETTTDTFTVLANDGVAAVSVASVVNIAVTPVNDAPTVTVPTTNLTRIEGTIDFTSRITINDSDTDMSDAAFAPTASTGTLAFNSSESNITNGIYVFDYTRTYTENEFGNQLVTITARDGATTDADATTVTGSFVIETPNTVEPPVVGNIPKTAFTEERDDNFILNFTAKDAPLGAFTVLNTATSATANSSSPNVTAGSIQVIESDPTNKGFQARIGLTFSQNFYTNDQGVSLDVTIDDGVNSPVVVSTFITVTNTADDATPTVSPTTINEGATGQTLTFTVTDNDLFFASSSIFPGSITSSVSGITVTVDTGSFTHTPGTNTATFTATLNASGAPNYNGPVTLTFPWTVAPQTAESLTVDLLLTNTSDPITAENKTAPATEGDGTTTFTLANNNIQHDDDPIASPTYNLSYTQPTAGTLGHSGPITSLSGLSAVNGITFTFTHPDTDFAGSVPIDFTLTDGEGETVTFTVTISVANTPDAATYTGVNIDFGKNQFTSSAPGTFTFSIVDPDTITATGTQSATVSSPTSGVTATATNTTCSNGTCIVTLTIFTGLGIEGDYSLDVSWDDGTGGSPETTTLFGNISTTNASPIFGTWNVPLTEPTTATPGTQTVTYTYTDIDTVGAVGTPSTTFTSGTSGISFTVTATTCNVNGICTVTVSIIVQPNFNGPYTALIETDDDNGGTGSTNISGSVTATNDPPTLRGVNTAQTLEEQLLALLESHLTQDPDGPDPEFESFTFADSTTTTSNNGSTLAFGSMEYTPGPNFHGTETISYTIDDNSGESNATASGTLTVTVLPVNDAPEIDSSSTLALTLNEGANETIITAMLEVIDVDDTPDNISYTISPAPTNGTLRRGTAGASGTVTFTSSTPITTFTQEEIGDGLIAYFHNGSETTSDSFTFSASDDGTDTTATDDTGGNQASADVNGTFNITINPTNDAPTLTTGNLTLNEGATRTILSTALSATDPDNTNAQLTFTVTTAPANGRIENSSAAGTAITTFTMAEVAAGTIRYVHDDSETTSDTISVTVKDPSSSPSSPKTITITITPQNDAPTATNDTISIAEDSAVQTLNAQLLANDTDADGDTLTIQSVRSITSITPNPGTLTLISGEVKYTPARNYNGSFTFTYIISDSNGESSTASATITITPVNDAPTVTINGPRSADAGEAVTFTATASDPDVGDTHTFVYTMLAAPSTASISNSNTTNSAIFEIPAGQLIAGGYTISVIARDSSGATSTARALSFSVAGSQVSVLRVNLAQFVEHVMTLDASTDRESISTIERILYGTNPRGNPESNNGRIDAEDLQLANCNNLIVGQAPITCSP